MFNTDDESMDIDFEVRVCLEYSFTLLIYFTYFRAIWPEKQSISRLDKNEVLLLNAHFSKPMEEAETLAGYKRKSKKK
jgi:hypothetical protein